MDSDRAWFKAVDGTWPHKTLERELCFESVIISESSGQGQGQHKGQSEGQGEHTHVLVVLDTQQDERFRYNPLVAALPQPSDVDPAMNPKPRP